MRLATSAGVDAALRDVAIPLASNTNDHFVVHAGPTSELAENRAALKLLQLLIRSYDLCVEDFYNNTCKGTRKTKDQSVQTDLRPNLVTWKNSCRYCNTQMRATKECRKRNVFKADKSTQFPIHFHIETPQHLVVYFLPFSKKLLDLNPIICKHPILSNTNSFFFFSHSRSIIKFLYQLPSGVYLMLILFFTFKAENLYINSQFYHSSGIYFEPI